MQTNALPNVGLPQQLQQQGIQHRQQQEYALSPIPHLLPASSTTPSFQPAETPVSSTFNNPVAPSAIPPGDSFYSFAQQPPATPPSLISAQSGAVGSGQQEPLQLLNIPVNHSYSHQPPSQHSQMAVAAQLLHTNPLTPTGSAQQTMTAQSQPKSRQPRNKSKFKRFRNAFIFYVNDQRSKVDEETKKLKNRPFLQLMSARWKSMTESERSPYVKQAERDKERFNDDVKKYGKYESRQRRYNKARSASREIPGQQGSMFGLSVGGGGVPPYQNTTGAANILYDDGYGNAMHQSQVQAQALAQAQIQHAHRQAQADAAAAFPSFYVGYTHGDPQANAVATASYPPPDLRHGGVANGTGAVPAIMTQSVQQGGLLCLPELATHRTSLSSSASSNELGDLRQSPLGHVFPWLTASDRLSAGNKVVGAGKPYPFYQNQPATPGGTFMQQVPAAIPIAHSLTEPMLYGGDAHSAQPQIPLAVQAQIRNGSALAHQKQAAQAQNYTLV